MEIVTGGSRECGYQSLVTGDNPTIEIASRGRTDLRAPGVERLFPLAHDIVVTPGLAAGDEELVCVDDTG